jgi:hypothetical protein
MTTDLASLLIRQEKLAVLGIADLRLAPSWGASATLDGTSTGAAGNVTSAPFAGFVQANAPVTLVDASDTNVDAGTVLEMHPAVHLALAHLYLLLQDGSGGTLLRPVPRFAFLSGGSGLPTGAVRPRDSLGSGSTMTFHDARGLFIDAGAVASCFAALMTLRPGLNTGTAGDLSSGLTALVGAAATAIQVLACSPQGTRWEDPGDGKGVTITTGSGTAAQRLGTDVLTLTDRTNANVHVEDSTSLVRAGLYPSGLIGTADVPLPAVPAGVTLNRDFLRVVCVDLKSYLPGSRDSGDVDTHTAAEPAPTVRDGVNVTTFLDGVDTLHAVSTVIGQALTSGEALLVSPDIAVTRLPGAGSTVTSSDLHWPTHPAFPSVPFEAWSGSGTQPLRRDGGVTASWAEAGSNDVFVSIAPGAVPAGAFVRVYPRRMVFPDTLAAGPSIVRGDGTATIAPTDTDPCVIRLTDPLALGTQARPSGANLNFDLLVVPRPASGQPRPRLLGGFAPTIADTVSPPLMPGTPTDFDEVDGFTDVPVTNRGVSHAGVLGFPRANPLSAVGWPASGSMSDIATFLVGLAESLADEGSPTQPRDAARMPTMARRETIAASRTGGTTQTWQALLTGGWLTPRSRTAGPRQGNPGWPAEGEYDTTAVSVDGQLAYDLARAALRRTRDLEGRMAPLNDPSTWQAPAAGSGRWAGAALQSVAAFCETPDLALVPDPSTLPDGSSTSSWSTVVSSLPSSVATALSGVLPTAPQAFAEIRREAFAAKFGRRDAQVALRRAIGNAREIVYIEAPRFGASSHGDGAPEAADGTEDSAAEWDIVQALVSRLLAAPSLQVVIGVPKLPDYPPQYESFALLEYQSRQAALTALTDAGAANVTIFHPIGFPGRPLRTGTSVVIVDDVWLMLGTSAPTRRGLTFDGAIDVALFDRQLDEGYSAGIRSLRRALMARHLQASPPAAGQAPSATWVKLARPAPAGRAMQEIVMQEAGNGLVESLYTPTPTAEHSHAAAPSLADPDGRNVSLLITAGAAALGPLEMLPAT